MAQNSKVIKRVAEHALLTVQGVWLTVLWFHYARLLGPIGGSMLEALVDGSAYRPYVYRTLAPLAVRWLMLTGVGLWWATVLVLAFSFIGWLFALLWLAGLVLRGLMPIFVT